MYPSFDCPICGALEQTQGYCWECGYDAELDEIEVDQVEDEDEADWRGRYNDSEHIYE